MQTIVDENVALYNPISNQDMLLYFFCSFDGWFCSKQMVVFFSFLIGEIQVAWLEHAKIKDDGGVGTCKLKPFTLLVGMEWREYNVNTMSRPWSFSQAISSYVI